MKKILSLVLALTMIFALATTAFAADNYTDDASFKITTSTQDDATGQGEGTSWKIDVTSKYDDNNVVEADIAANYYVVLSWDIESTLKFSVDAGDYTWNVYSNNEERTVATDDAEVTGAGYELIGGDWSGEATVKVTLTNWSNRAVSATVGFEAAKKDIAAGVVRDIDISEEGAYTVEYSAADATKITAKAASDSLASIDGLKINIEDIVTSAATDSATVKIDGTKLGGVISKNDAVIGTVTVTLEGLATNYAVEDVTPTEAPAGGDESQDPNNPADGT